MLFPNEGIVIKSALWFLPVMFITSIVYYFINVISKNNKIIVSAIIIVLCTLGFLSTFFTLFKRPFGIDVSLVALLFYHIGRMANEINFMNLINNLKRKYYVFILLLSCIVVALIFFNTKVNMRLMQWGFIPLGIVNALIASFLVIII